MAPARNGPLRGGGGASMAAVSGAAESDLPPLQRVQCLSLDGFYDVAFRVWGVAEAAAGVETVVCCHALTRNMRDFDTLARALVAARPGR
jgi:hypothetical protein